MSHPSILFSRNAHNSLNIVDLFYSIHPGFAKMGVESDT